MFLWAQKEELQENSAKRNNRRKYFPILDRLCLFSEGKLTPEHSGERGHIFMPERHHLINIVARMQPEQGQAILTGKLQYEIA